MPGVLPPQRQHALLHVQGHLPNQAHIGRCMHMWEHCAAPARGDSLTWLPPSRHAPPGCTGNGFTARCTCIPVLRSSMQLLSALNGIIYRLTALATVRCKACRCRARLVAQLHPQHERVREQRRQPHQQPAKAAAHVQEAHRRLRRPPPSLPAPGTKAAGACSA